MSIRSIFYLIVGFLLLSGCIGGDRIGDILKKPEEYSGKMVNLRGEVTEVFSIPLVSQGAYKLDDGSGSIWIITESGTPAKGKTVSVKGTVKTAFVLGGIRGTVVIEESRS